MLRFVAFVTLSWCAIRASADEPAVWIAPDGDDPTRVTVSCALPSGLSSATVSSTEGARHLTFAVVDEATGRAGEPMFGSYSVVDDRLTFRPRFGLVRGATYRATAASATVDYQVPDPSTDEQAKIVSITPTGEVLPANVLRFYVTFSRPMREGRQVLETIRLVDDEGKEINAPWRELELWNADATRLSLFLHPGRIKKGVNLREQLGPILEPGRRYTLIFPAELRDARGVPMAREVRRSFTTTDELRRRMDVGAWRVTAPAAATSDLLTIGVDRPLDSALARRCLAVHDAVGNPIAGVWEPAEAERRWAFRPAAPWKAERYALVVDPVLEDVCGNTPVREFDFDLDTAPIEVLLPTLRREFTPQ